MNQSLRIDQVGRVLVLMAVFLTPIVKKSQATELHVGGATVSITPDKPVSLAGQMHTRISTGVESPVTATALALESREGDRVVDQAILISCDLVMIGDEVLEAVRERLKRRIASFDAKADPQCHPHAHGA